MWFNLCKVVFDRGNNRACKCFSQGEYYVYLAFVLDENKLCALFAVV